MIRRPVLHSHNFTNLILDKYLTTRHSVMLTKYKTAHQLCQAFNSTWIRYKFGVNAGFWCLPQKLRCFLYLWWIIWAQFPHLFHWEELSKFDLILPTGQSLYQFIHLAKQYWFCRVTHRCSLTLLLRRFPFKSMVVEGTFFGRPFVLLTDTPFVLTFVWDFNNILTAVALAKTIEKQTADGS